MKGDWTYDEAGRANSSRLFQDLTCAVARIISGSAYDLIGGRTMAVAKLVLAQLAHKHGFGPLPMEKATPDLLLRHEYKGLGRAIPGCKQYMGGDVDEVASYCGQPESAHRPGPDLVGDLVEALRDTALRFHYDTHTEANFDECANMWCTRNRTLLAQAKERGR